MTDQAPEQQDDQDRPQVVGLQGDVIAAPHGVWLAAVNPDGELVRTDQGFLVRVR